MKAFQVGLLGAGVVGGGTFAVLQRNQEEIRRRAGREIRITQVADVDVARARRVAGDAAEVGSDARALIARPEIERQFDESLGTLKREAAVPVFRPGRAPRGLVQKRLSFVHSGAQSGNMARSFGITFGECTTARKRRPFACGCGCDVIQ